MRNTWAAFKNPDSQATAQTSKARILRGGTPALALFPSTGLPWGRSAGSDSGAGQRGEARGSVSIPLPGDDDALLMARPHGWEAEAHTEVLHPLEWSVEPLRK